MLDFKTSSSKSEVSKLNSWKITSFSKSMALQGELFLTMFYTINLSPLLVTEKDFMLIIILREAFYHYYYICCLVPYKKYRKPFIQETNVHQVLMVWLLIVLKNSEHHREVLFKQKYQYSTTYLDEYKLRWIAEGETWYQVIRTKSKITTTHRKPQQLSSPARKQSRHLILERGHVTSSPHQPVSDHKPLWDPGVQRKVVLSPQFELCCALTGIWDKGLFRWAGIIGNLLPLQQMADLTWSFLEKKISSRRDIKTHPRLILY